MSEPQVIVTLRAKRDDIERYIGAMEKKVAQARLDLAHVNAVIRLFEVNGDPLQFPVHMGLRRLFKRGELFGLCLEALQASESGLDTRELAVAVVRAKGLDDADKHLRQAVAYSIVNALTRQAKRGKVHAGPKRRGVRVWNTAQHKTGAINAALDNRIVL